LRTSLTAFGLSAVPLIALAVMAVAGRAEPWSAVLAMALCYLAAAALAAVWCRDLGILAASLRRIAADSPAPVSQAAAVLRPAQQLEREIERVARRITAHDALVDQFRRADAAIIERLPDPLIVLGGGRDLLRANPAAHAAFGADIRALLRHPVLNGAIERAFAQRMPQAAEFSLPVPVPRDLLTVVVPMEPPLADGGRAVLVVSDRTQERALQRTRADFVANASHELRTPLASLIGFIDTLRGPAADDPPAQQRFLAIMAAQGARMNRLIDDLLSLSRIELMENQPPSERLDLATLAASVLAGFEPRLQDRSVRLESYIAGGLPQIAGDSDQIAQVLQNLLENAVKYGGAEGTVRLEIRPATQGGRWPPRSGVVMTIADQGPGIPREHLPRLTERFYRVDTGRSRAAGGTGLGLAIVKHIVNRHRGQLAIDSEEGVGTTVSVWLPH
jgi:two-component system phosphate regulon sensor histidine kinase PhoR